MFGIGISDHIRIFLLSFGFGFLLGIAYDILKLLSIVFPRSRKIFIIRDILFSLVTIFSVFNFCLIVNKGEFRGYIFWAIATGFVIYRFSFGKVTIYILTKLFKFISLCLKIILFPFRKIVRKIRKKYRSMVKKSKKFKKNSNLLLQSTEDVLYNKLKSDNQ